MHGWRDILGYYIGEGDSKAFWSELLEDFQSRGLADILIACVDEPTTLGETFKVFYPQTHLHGCLMLQMQNSLSYLVGADKKVGSKALKALYTVADETEATKVWQAIKAVWNGRYPLVVENWERNWTMLMTPLHYPPLVRARMQRFTLIDTLSQDLLRYTRVDGPYGNDDEFFKSAYGISRHILSDYKVSISGWGLLIQQLSALFGDRVTKQLAT